MIVSLAQVAADLEAVDIGQAEIEHDELGLGVEHGDLGIATGGDPACRMPGPFKGSQQRSSDRCVIFDQ